MIGRRRRERETRNEGGFHIRSAERLADHENVDLLPEAFDRVADSVSSVSLEIVAEGPERERLERQIRTLEHAGRVPMP